MSTKSILAAALAGALIATSSYAQNVETHIGKIEVEGGYPSKASLDKIIDELDFQRACQAYIWGLPIVGIAEWQKTHDSTFKVRNGQWVSFLNFGEKLGIMTPNFDTPYVVGLADLEKNGPLVFELPKGLMAGMLMDAWQRSLSDLGVVGPDKGQGGKYLILGPGQEDPKAEGYFVFRSTTRNIFFGVRLLDPDRERAARELVPLIRSYAWSDRNNPSNAQPVSAGTKWTQTPPTGIAYWESLAGALDKDSVQERDRFFMAMLKPLGIEKGKPFKPDARQKKILTDAAEVGQWMAKANTYTKRFEDPYWPGMRWKDSIAVNVSQRVGEFEQLDERASYFYEAVAISEAMRSTTPGFGQHYMGTYQDKEGGWLVGANNYHLRVPADPPAKQFWSLTLYDTETRTMIQNPGNDSARSGLDKLKTNADGSIELYFGPAGSAPAGLEANWIETLPGKGFYPMFRVYYPKAGLFDGTWKLSDIEVMK